VPARTRLARQGARALGERLEFTAEASRRFHLRAPYVPHQEINASPDDLLECVLVRGHNVVVINLDIEGVDQPKTVAWVDPIHKR
jgi:uncharacterized RmlC-like cupin family protein